MKKVQKAKLKEFRNYLKEKNICVALFSNLHMQEFDPNFYYFSDYSGLGFLVVPKDKKPFLIVPEMELGKAKREATTAVVVAKKGVAVMLRKKIGKMKNIGIDKKGMTVAFFDRLKKELKGVKIKYMDIGQKCAELRLTKTPEEIKRIRKACKITDKIFSKTFFNFKKFKTEADVAHFMVGEVIKLGLEVSFKPIVASGVNATEPHHGAPDVKLKKGFCVIDFGIRYKGYCSDMTRTVYLGKPTQKDLEIYGLVLSAQKNSIKSVKLGVSCKLPDDTAIKTFGKLSKYFVHSTGHGVGLDIHEDPSLAKGEKLKFMSGMVFTIEPGLYFPRKLGIRIEDDILVTEKGVTVLTKTGKNLLIIK